jgi:hypothetical protein
VQKQGQRGRLGQRGGGPGQAPAHFEHGHVRRDRADQVGDREEQQARDQHALAAEPVTERAGRDQQRGEDDHVRVDDPDQLIAPRVEVAGGELGQGQVGRRDEGLQDDHHEAADDEGQAFRSHDSTLGSALSNVKCIPHK